MQMCAWFLEQYLIFIRHVCIGGYLLSSMGGSGLNKILLIHVEISVKQVLLLILVCNLVLLSEYVIC